MKRFTQRYLAVMVALIFLLAVPPVEARVLEEDEGCFACADCYPELWCPGCGIYAHFAVSGCCGMGEGTTYCMQDWGGFAVNCNNGARACQCNMTGEHCVSLVDD